MGLEGRFIATADWESNTGLCKGPGFCSNFKALALMSDLMGALTMSSFSISGVTISSFSWCLLLTSTFSLDPGLSDVFCKLSGDRTDLVYGEILVLDKIGGEIISEGDL